MFKLLRIIFAARIVYLFDLNFLSEKTTGKLILNGRVDIICPNKNKFSMNFDMDPTNSRRELTADGYWFIRFDFSDPQNNIQGNSYIRMQHFEGDLKDIRIGMTITTTEAGKFEIYQFTGDVYAQRFPITSDFICDSRRKFNIQVKLKNAQTCTGELDILFFKFVMDQHELTQETHCVPERQRSNIKSMHSAISSPLKPIATILSFQTGNLKPAIENQISSVNPEPLAGNSLTLMQPLADNLLAITQPQGGNPLTLTQPPADNPLTLTQPSAENPLIITQPSLDNSLTLTRPPADNPLTLTQPPAYNHLAITQPQGGNPLTLTQPLSHNPLTLAQPPAENPLTLTQPPADNPLTLTQPLAENPLTLIQPSVDNHLKLTQPPADNHLALTQPSADNPLTLTHPPADNPLTITQPSADNPLTITQPLADNPLTITQLRLEVVPKKSQSLPLVPPIKTQSTSVDTTKNTQTPHTDIPKTYHPRDITTISKSDSTKAYLDASASHNKKQSLIIGMILFSSVVLGITVYLIFRFHQK